MSNSDPPPTAKARHTPPDPPPSLAGTATDLDVVPEKKPRTSPWSIAFAVAVVVVVLVLALLRG